MTAAATIVILASGGAALLEPALDRVLGEARARTPSLPVIAVDPRAEPAVASLVRSRAGVRLIVRAGGEGPASAVNAAVASAVTPFLILLEEDRVPEEEGFAWRLLETFDGTSGALLASAWRRDSTSVGPWTPRFDRGRVVLTDDPVTAPLGAAAYDRALWAALGGLDPRFASRVWAEADLAWRARRRGWRLTTVDARASGTRRAAPGPRTDAAVFERDRLLFTWKNLGRAMTARHLAWLPWHAVRAGQARGAVFAGLAAAISELGSVRRARRFEKMMARLTDRSILATFEGA